MASFDMKSPSPLFKNLSNPMVFHGPNPSIWNGSSHSSHDVDESLRVPLEQVHKFSTKIGKMYD